MAATLIAMGKKIPFTRVDTDVCPKCSGPVKVEEVCPGHYANGHWGYCWPRCGTSLLWECESIPCGWWFIDGMNPRNVLFADNETRRPWWLNTKLYVREAA